MKRMILIFTLAALLAGCSTSTSTTAPAATDSVMLPEPTACVVSTQPVLYGIWENEKGDVLVFSETSVYMVQADDSSGTPYIRETWYEVQSMDWVNGVATVMMKSVRINGQGAGFDMPLHYIKVTIDGTTLMYGMGDEGSGIPATTEIGPFTRK